MYSDSMHIYYLVAVVYQLVCELEGKPLGTVCEHVADRFRRLVYGQCIHTFVKARLQ
jgi:hypothetical protein